MLPRQDSDLDLSGRKPSVLPLDHGALKADWRAVPFALQGSGTAQNPRIATLGERTATLKLLSWVIPFMERTMPSLTHNVNTAEWHNG